MKKPTVLIAEDEYVIREGELRVLLEPEFSIVAAVGDGIEAVEAAKKYRPEIALLDVSLPGLRGFEVARQILITQPDCKVVFISCHSQAAYIEGARQIGASGYVIKNRVSGELLNAIRTALSGRFYAPEV
jgi:DNA-binding NarL/FixJ family response regulator